MNELVVCCEAGAGCCRSSACLPAGGAGQVLLSCLCEWRPFSFCHPRVSLFRALSPIPLGWQRTTGILVGRWEAGYLCSVWILVRSRSAPSGVQELCYYGNEDGTVCPSSSEKPCAQVVLPMGLWKIGNSMSVCAHAHVPTGRRAAHHPLW